MAETETNQMETQERTPDEIQRDIEETREELAETAAAVAHKTDVKAQARRKVDETKAQAQSKVEEAKTAARENDVPVAAIAGGVAAAIVLIWLWRR